MRASNLSSMSIRNLVPQSPIGKELDQRFNEFSFRKNPDDAPMSRALTAYGYHVDVHPFKKKYTDTDWLGSRVSMNGLSIIFRQPTPSDLLICSIDRETKSSVMQSPLFGTVEFIYFCHVCCYDVKYLGGCIGKASDIDPSSHLTMDRLIHFYYRTLGYIECYKNIYGLWIYADMRCPKRFKEFPIWERHRKRWEQKMKNKKVLKPKNDSLISSTRSW